MTEFYTYIYYRRDGTPYYVGKGSGERAFTRNSRNVPVPERARIVIEYWASEKRALEMECWYVALFGRKDNGTGVLRNLTDGGDGVSGYKHTDDTRSRIGKAGIGRRPRLGMRNSERSKQLVRAALLGVPKSAEHSINISKGKRVWANNAERCRAYRARKKISLGTSASL